MQRTLFILSLVGLVGCLIIGLAQSLTTQGRLPGLAIDPLEQAREMLARCDLPGATAQYRAAALIDASGATDLFQGALGDGAEPSPRDDAALATLRDACHARPAEAAVWGSLASALLAADRSSEALLAFSQAVRLAPRDASFQAGLAGAFLRRDRPGQALALYRRAVELDPEDATLQNDLGTVEAALGRYDEAARRFALALRLDPTLATARANLALALRDRAAKGGAR